MNLNECFSFIIDGRGRKAAKGTNLQQFYQGMRYSSVDEPQKILLTLFNRIVDKITNDDVSQATKEAYHAVWRNFNHFLLCFDDFPTSWEDKMVLYATFLADIGSASSTVASYMSAIRYVL